MHICNLRFFLIILSIGITGYGWAQPMAGSFTVGSGGTYATLEAAVTDVTTRGVNGAVTFRLRNGTFNEQITIGVISGVSATNTITFESESGNAANVILTFAATATATNYIVRLDNANFIRFRHLTFQPAGMSFNRAIYGINNLNDIRFENLVFNLPVTTSVTEDRAAILARPTLSSNLRFINNTITGGAYGILHVGNSTNRSPGTVFTGNTITNSYYRPAFFESMQGGVFNNNTITNSVGAQGDYYGLAIQNTNGYMEILRNKITGAVGHALRLQACAGVDTQPSLVANNFLHSASSGYSALDYGFSISHTLVYHNSVNQSGTGPAFYFNRSSSTGNRIVNNIFRANTGYAISYENAQIANSIIESDHNNLFTSGSFIARAGGTNYGTLAEFRTASGSDANSVNFDPQYASDTNLTASAPGIASAGKNLLSVVPTDINNDPRTATPSIGADQLSAAALIPLNGTYTVGTGQTYTTINAAINAMKVNGISGAVTFQLASQTFTEQFVLPSISGSSATNTITFQSQSGNAANTILSFNAAAAATNYIAQLSNASFVTFRNLTLNPIGTSFNRAIHLINRADDIRFENLVFNLPVTTSVTEDRAAILARPTLSSNLRFINNTITGGAYGILHVGNSTNRSPGTVFTGNTITNSYYRPAFFESMQGGVFNNNTITNSVGAQGDYYGLAIQNTNGYMEILRNKITGAVGHALRLQACAGVDTQPSLVANNFLHSASSGYSALDYGFSISHTLVYHNSVNQSGTGPAFYFNRSSSTGNRIVNNIFRANTGYAISYENAQIANSIIESDHNNLFTSGSFIARAGGTNYGTLAEFRTASGSDANSVNFDPQYASDTNLTASAPGIASAGKNLSSSVPDDINGVARPSTPSLGANQFGSSGSPISGQYTINVAGSGATNFTSFTVALDALKNSGVNGPIVFKVTGEFNEQVTLLAVPGSSATNTITFESATGQPADAILRFAANNASTNFTLRLSNADHHVIRNMTIRAEGVGFGRAIQLSGRTLNILVEGNIAESVTTTSTSNNLIGLEITSTLGQQVRIINNVFRNGAYGISYQGPSSKATGSIVRGNIVDKAYYRGMDFNNQTGIIIEQNQILNNPSAPSFTGLELSSSDGAYRITENKITGGNGRALAVSNVFSALGNPGLIANNFFQTNNTSGYQTVYLFQTLNLNVYHNNINATGTDAALYFYYNAATPQNINIVNNILKSNGYVINISTPASIGQLNYNNYFTTGTNLARWGNTDLVNLPALQTASGQNANSLSVDPQYQSNANLESLASSLAGAGLDLTALVPTDINGVTRVLPVSIGATQFIPATTKDGTISRIITPASSCLLTNAEPVRIEITNMGATPITGFQVSYRINSGAAVVESIPAAVTISPGGKFEYTFAQVANLAAKQVYTLRAAILLSGDEDVSNDQLDGTVTHFPDIITTISNAVTICQGQSTALQATGGIQYLWTPGGATAATINVSPISTTPYSVLITNANACQQTREVIVTVKPIPQISFTNESGYTTSYVSPTQGATDALFDFRMIYTDAGGNLPAAGYPRVELDANNNGQATDPLDIIRVMQAADAADSDVTDGKEYRVTITNLSETINWRSRIAIQNVVGCPTQTNFITRPLVSNDLLDVAIFANDISFSKTNPAINEPIRIYARIRNTSDYLAENFVVSAYIEEVQVFTQTVTQVNPQSSITLQWDQSFIASGFYPVKLVLDETNALLEDNELNNFAVRPVLAGNYVLPGGIDVAATNIAPLTLQANQFVSISGKAQYFGIEPGVNPDVAGATAIARITGGSQAQTTTQADGNYQLSVRAPSIPGTYLLTLEVTDYTLTGYQGPITITVLPSPPLPDLSTTITLSKNTILPGELVTGTATLRNNGQLTASNFIFRYFSCEQVLGEHTIASLAPGESLTYTFDATTNNIGDCFNASSCNFQSSADVNNQVIETTKVNNNASTSLRVLPNKPDLTPINTTNQSIPGQVNMVNPFIFTVRADNIGGIDATTSFNVNVYIDEVLVRTQPFPSLSTCTGTNFQVNHTFADLSDHVVTIRVDEPIGSGSIDEYRETNNEFSKTIRHLPPPPQFPNLNVGFQDIAITPTLPPVTTNFNLQVAYRNNGQITLNPPFNIELIVVEAGITRIETRAINSTMAPGALGTTTLTTNLQTDGNHLFRVRLDPENAKVESTKVDNVTQIPLCVDLQVNSVWGGNFYVNTVQNLTATISNLGIFTASNVPVSFFLDNVKIASTTLTTVGPVNSANAQSVSTPFLFNQLGTFELKVVVDELNAYTECREDNNEYKATITVRAPLPDLRIVSEYIAPSKINPDVNEPITIFVSYDNIGIGATGPFKARVLVDDVPIGPDVTIASVVAGEDGTVEVPTPYLSPTAGIRVIRTILDPDSELTETSKANNQATRALVVGQAPNLFFTNLESSIPCPNNGADVILIASITNAGDLEATASVHFFYISDSDTIRIDTKIITVFAKGRVTVKTDWLVLDKTYPLYAEIRDSTPEEFDKSDNSILTKLCGGPYFNLVVVAEGQGIIEKTPNQQRYEGVQQVEVTAVPASGWIFTGWQGDIISLDNPLVIDLSSDQQLSAVFAEVLNIPTTSPVQRCGPGEVVVQVSGAVGAQTYAWYENSTGGIPFQNTSADTFTTPSLTTTTSYFVSISSFTSESPRTEVVATILALPPQPPITLDGNDEICLEKLEEVILVAPSGYQQYAWSTSQATPQITVSEVGTYSVLVTDANGCESTSSEVIITARNCTELIIYNGISPNSDVLNSYFKIENIDVLPETRANQLKIYNRWGDLVFETKNYDNINNAFTGVGKNGKELPSGNYFYQLDFLSGKPSMRGYLDLRR